MSRSILEEAQEIIYGDREETYGDPAVNLNRIARSWSVYVLNKYGAKLGFTATDVAMMMIEMKICRHQHKPKRDNLVDIAGYSALSERIGNGD